MKIALDPDKSPFYSVGSSFFLSVADPGPIEIDLEDFPEQEKNQIVYGLKTGVLLTEDEVKVETTYSTPQEAPVKEVPVPEDITLDQQLSAMKQEAKKVLSGKVATVKRRLGDIQNIHQLKTLFSVEKEGSSRKGVLKALQQLLDTQVSNIQENINKENVKVNEEQVKKTELIRGLKGLVNLDNITDVVESEVEQITIKYPEEE